MDHHDNHICIHYTVHIYALYSVTSDQITTPHMSTSPEDRLPEVGVVPT